MERGYVRSLTEVNPELAAAITADLLPALRSQSSFHDEVYAIPGDADFALLGYRRDWFAAEGRKPAGNLGGVARLSAPFPETRRPYGTVMRSVRTRSHSPEAERPGRPRPISCCPSFGRPGADVIANHEVVLNTQSSRDAVTFVADLVGKYGVAGRDVIKTPWNGPALAFAACFVAMSIGGQLREQNHPRCHRLERTGISLQSGVCADSRGAGRFAGAPPGTAGSATRSDTQSLRGRARRS